MNNKIVIESVSYGDLGGCYPDEASVIKAAISYLSFVPLPHLWPNLAKKLIIKSVSVGKLKKHQICQMWPFSTNLSCFVVNPNTE